MIRSPEYDKDIAEMYGTADPSILFEVSEDKRIARAMGFGYAYYPQNDPLPGLIAQLFGNGQQGVMYIPKPQVLGQQVLFQDAAGTVPVMNDGDPVGLMLDLSRERGPELLANGTDAGSWAARANTSLSMVDGKLRVAAIGSGAFGVDFIDTPSIDSSKTYEASVTVNSGVTQLYIRANAPPAVTVSSGRSVTRNVSVGGMGEVALATNRGSAGQYFDIESVSLRELPGNHARQTTSASRPIYRTDGALHWLEGDGVDDFLITDPIMSLATDDRGISFAMAARRTGVEALRVSQYGIANNARVWNTRINTTTPASYSWGVQLNTTFNNNHPARTPTPHNEPHTMSGRWRGAGERNEVRVNRGAWVAGSQVVNSSGTPLLQPVEIFSDDSGDRPVSGMFYGLVVRDEFFGDDTHNEVEGYFATLAGITL